MAAHDTNPKRHLAQGLRRPAARVAARAVAAGMPPGWAGWRWVREETVGDYFARGGAGEYETIHPPARADNPLPRNIDDPTALSDDPDWFGFSLRDVPKRQSGETFRATLPDCTVVTFNDLEKDRFWPTILNRDNRALILREMRYRAGHAAVLRQGAQPVRMAEATWIAERVYENHSHWLTAHLPKLCLLKARGELDGLILPARRSPSIDASLRMLDIAPENHIVHDPARPLKVDRLTVYGTDRFRPELLRPVRNLIGHPVARPWRKVFISRAGAAIRRLVDEAAITPMLRDAGFELVRMEDLDFEAQVRLMGETRVLAAPHGAGLTNMMFCPEGAHVVEIATPLYPNPNFYALACALGLNYWMVAADFAGPDEIDRLDRDLTVDPAALARVLSQIDG